MPMFNNQRCQQNALHGWPISMNLEEAKMMGHAGCAEDVLMMEDFEIEADMVKCGQRPSPVGTFALRRANYLTEAGRTLLSAEQQRALHNLFREIDPEKRRKTIVRNLRMVIEIALRYTERGVGLFDLVRAGNDGLIHALEKYEPHGGFQFSIFATDCICQNIECALLNRNSPPFSFRSEPAHKDSLAGDSRKY
jgi:DNA-directed RNA polymerase sigma subunit (sigma70/sigma32)